MRWKNNIILVGQWFSPKLSWKDCTWTGIFQKMGVLGHTNILFCFLRVMSHVLGYFGGSNYFYLLLASISEATSG